MAVPLDTTEHFLQMLGESFLNQPVFTIDVGDHGSSLDHDRYSGHDLEHTIKVKFLEILPTQYRF